MKVLYCYRYGILGGVCTQLIHRLQALRDSDQFEAHLFFSRDYGISRTLSGYPHLYFDPDPKKLRELAAEGNFDAVIVIDTAEYLEAVRGLEHVPVITEVHTTTERGLVYLQDSSWRTSGYIVPSEYSRWMLRERFGIGRDAPVRVVPNSLDATLFPRVEIDRPGSRPVFAWVGKLDDHKNWRGFLRVAAQITQRGLDAEFWLVGGETAPAPVQEEFIEKIEELGLHDRCRWFPRIEHNAMHRVYGTVRASGGAAIVTSINESFGMSVLEAVTSGCPVVASRVGALPEVAPGRSYLRFYERDAYQEAAAIAVEMAQAQQADRVREDIDRDHDWLLRRYSCQTVAQQYLDTVHDILSGAASASIHSEIRRCRLAVKAAADKAAVAKAAADKAAALKAAADKVAAVKAATVKVAAVASGANNGNGELALLRTDLEDSILDLRRRMPEGRWGPRDPAEYLQYLGSILDQRSYQVARRLCNSPRNLKFWIRLPLGITRAAFFPRR